MSARIYSEVIPYGDGPRVAEEIMAGRRFRIIREELTATDPDGTAQVERSYYLETTIGDPDGDGRDRLGKKSWDDVDEPGFAKAVLADFIRKGSIDPDPV